MRFHDYMTKSKKVQRPGSRGGHPHWTGKEWSYDPETISLQVADHLPGTRFRPWEDDSIVLPLRGYDWAELAPSNVSLASLRGSQEQVKRLSMVRYARGEQIKRGNDLPRIVHYQGYNWVLDGHHRAIHAKLTGKKNIKVRVFDLDRYLRSIST